MNKQNRQTKKYREQTDGFAKGRRVDRLGEKGEGIERYKLVVTK